MSYIRPPDPGGTLSSGNINFNYSTDVNKHIDNLTENKIQKGNSAPRFKRQRPSSPLLLETTAVKPRFRFLIVKRTNGESMTKISPFLIEKLLTQIAGDKSIKSAKKLRDGTMLVETFTYEQSEKLLSKLPENEILPVSVEPHKTLNKVKGVITCYDLDCVDIEEVKEQLKDQGVEDVIRITRRIDNTTLRQPTNSYIIIFGLTTLPEKVKIGYLSVPIRPYIPLPFRCLNCHKFNHSKITCKSIATCSGCGDPVHENECKVKRCVNCDGNHASTDKDCPRWQLEKKISEIRTLEKISYNEAKNKVKIVQPTLFARSYSDLLKVTKVDKSDKVKKIMKDQGTQCFIPQESGNREKITVPRNSIQIEENQNQINLTTASNKTNPADKLKEEVSLSIQAKKEMMWANQWDCDTEDSTVSSHCSDKSGKDNKFTDNSPDKNKTKHKPRKKRK